MITGHPDRSQGDPDRGSAAAIDTDNDEKPWPHGDTVPDSDGQGADETAVTDAAAPLEHAMQAVADVTMAPVQALRGHAHWLRAALLIHVASTLSVTVIGLRLGLDDWQLYGWTGLGCAVLVGNFMRWPRRAGWVRRVVSTGLATGVVLVWTVLLLDRASQPWHASLTVQVIDQQWFWLPVVLLVLSAALLIAHLFAAPPPPLNGPR